MLTTRWRLVVLAAALLAVVAAAGDAASPSDASAALDMPGAGARGGGGAVDVVSQLDVAASAAVKPLEMSATEIAERDPKKGPEVFGISRPEYRPVKSDIKYIKCAFCRQLLAEAEDRVARLRERIKPLQPTEAEVAESLDLLCSLGGIGENAWIRQLDMVEQEDRTIAIERHPEEGFCAVECTTMAATCDTVFREYDMDLATLMYRTSDHARLEQALCYDWTEACVNPPPKAPKSRKPGEAWQKVGTHDIELERYMNYLNMAGKNNYQRTKPRPIKPPPQPPLDPRGTCPRPTGLFPGMPANC